MPKIKTSFRCQECGYSTVRWLGRSNLPAGRQGGKGLYISGEESLQQVKDRAHRLGLKSPSLSLVSETELSKMLEAVERVSPTFCVIDSIQTTYREDLSSAPGSV